ncbi:MAG: CHASE4 domain-containing protein [Candidatus Pacearchaeota archaeon]|jgi:sensor domain CHASE-containing protein
MKLKYKFTLISSLILIISFIIIHIISVYTISNVFLKLEEDQVNTNLLRIKEINDNQINELDKFVNDWGVWDEAHIFVRDNDFKFIEKYVNYDILSNVEIDFMVYTNSTNDIIYSTKLDYNNQEILTPYLSIEDFIKNNKIVDLNKEDIKGVINLPEGPAYFAIKSIEDGKNNEKSYGKLLAGKYIIQQGKKMEDILKFPIKISKYDENIIKSYEKKDLNSFYEKNIFGVILGYAILQNSNLEDSIFLKREKNTIFSYSIIKDINNKPVAIIEFELKRTIYNQGLYSLRFFLGSLFILLIISLFSIFILYNYIFKDFLKRINDLNESIISINKGNFETGLKIKNNDEISELSKSLKEMSENLKEYNIKIKESNKNLEKKVNERTIELEEKNKELEKFNKLSTGREIEMIKLKKELLDLKEKNKK